jgi:glycine/D-amino acid oxidase-like deaminating enzyme
MAKKRVGIIGGGIIGCSIAFHLTSFEGIETTAFEKSQIGWGTTAKSAGTLCLLDDSLPEKYFDQRVLCLKTYKQMNEGQKGAIGFKESGTLVVCLSKQELERAQKHVEMSWKAGFSAEYFDDPNKLKKYVPDLNVAKAVGGSYTANDGYADSTAIAVAYANKARARGAKILTGTKVTKIVMDKGRVSGVETSKGIFDFDIVVNAGGPWGNQVGEMAGLKLPLWHTKAEVFILRPKSPLGYAFPILKYPTWYSRAEGDDIFVCRSHMAMDLSNPAHAGVWDPDALPAKGGTEEYFWEFLFEQLSENMPRLTEGSVVSDWVGYRSVTKDKLPILGESGIPGFLLANGPSGNGVILAPGIGQELSTYIATGEKGHLLQTCKLERFF